ncbi:SGNH/GDSL hydrolase family protein [Streptomyces spirodelae]|uniref:SGNH/GDSL hydrolase family protein n=1 Tax=Streptomyces spirodelae TaxID=2812904 RepID=A0ABS3WQD7_9ACTN|nr:SGNH/GDSL hydrolase family protein [Streptomyces spirodelae]MBO8185339.1 SGNH/GDSL hydrolase family protein [Streptomyces spirodelae]
MRRRTWTRSLTILVAAVSATAPTLVATATAQDRTRHPAQTAEAAQTAQPTAPTDHALPLERLFDNRAVSNDADPSAADFDGAGRSLSAQDLRAAGWAPGTRLDLDAAPLRLPDRAPGRPDNVIADGQRVRVGGHGNALSFLVAATSPRGPAEAASGKGTVRYRDGSRSSYTLTAGDWRGGPLATKAVALPHLNTRQGDQLEEKVKLYAVTVPLERGRDVHSVTLPKDPGPDSDLHIFDVAVRPEATGWTGSWAASTGGYTGTGQWRDQTLRLVVHTSAGGPRARIRLENTFAAEPVRIGHASIAVQKDGAAAHRRPTPLTFDGGHEGTRIPAGARAVSDPVGFDVPSDTNLLVSIHLPDPVPAAPVHSKALQRSYLSEGGSGDRTGEAGGGAFTRSLIMWPFLTGVDVQGGPGSVVTLGDSITDGVRSTEGANRRWPDILAGRLLAQSDVPRFGVLNHGISANRIVTDRYPGDGVSTDTAGVSAQHRLERDVLAQTSARTVVLFEGINDVRWGASAEEVITGMKAIAARAKERGLRVVVATITPCEGYHDCTAEVDAKRTKVNAFVRENGGRFDAVLDFDAVVRDPSHPARMLPKYDSGDHLHPGDAGLRAIGESVDLRLLAS